MNEIELFILNNTAERFKWITKNKLGCICIWAAKPEKGTSSWTAPTVDWTVLTAFDHLFNDIKWEDTEPYKFR